MPGLNTFLLVVAAIFPVVNPPGAALVFLGLTQDATPEIRNSLAGRVALNSFIVLVSSLLLGALILQFYGISIPILRVAGGFIVAVSGWKLLNLTTGPGTIAVVISLGLSKGSSTNWPDEIIFVIACLLAIVAIAVMILFCFRYADRIQRLLGRGGTDIAVRLFAFILFCLGVQILWAGASDLLSSVIHHRAHL
jgi:multiple antibiotic resistance protein